MEGNKCFLRPVIDLQATGNKIKELRKTNKYSIKDIQDVFGFEYPQAVYAWEQGKNVPTIDNLLILSKLFGVQIEQIVCVTNVEIKIACSSNKEACAEKVCDNCKLKTA